MKKYHVQITDEALRDMDELYQYIADTLLEPDYAIGQYNRIADAILTLDEFPERFRLMESDLEKAHGIHRMIVDHYSVFYVIEENMVYVTDVLYSASDLESRLKAKY